MRPLVVAQLALAVAVVFSAALLGRSLVNFAHVDPGYDTDRIVSASFNPAASGYADRDIPALSARLVAAVLAVPGVSSAAGSTCGLLDNCTYSSSYVLDDDRARGEIALDENYVGPGYFSTVGVPAVAGREFDDRDREGGALVAIVSESVARRYFAGRSALGRRIGDREFSAEIVGVVADTRPYSLRDAPLPMVYFPLLQWPVRANNLAVRAVGDPAQSVAAVRAAVERSEPGLVVDNVGTMALRVGRSILRERLVAYLAAAFGGLSLLLGCVGLYGVLSYAVARRRQEFGVRLALGASPGDLTRGVTVDALRVAVAGTAAGLAIGLGASRLLGALLFGVNAFDPVPGLAAAAVLFIAVLATCFFPARRAARVDPVTALRAE